MISFILNLYRVSLVILGADLVVVSTESASPPIQILSNSVDKIVVHKSQRRLDLYCQDNLIKTYKIALGKNPVGHKARQGDNKTPEGTYTISAKNPNSSYHKSLRISYPNQADVLCAKKRCVNPGGDVMIHGLDKKSAWIGKDHAARDWTQGCVAVSNGEMDEIYTATKVGATIIIHS